MGTNCTPVQHETCEWTIPQLYWWGDMGGGGGAGVNGLLRGAPSEHQAMYDCALANMGYNASSTCGSAVLVLGHGTSCN